MNRLPKKKVQNKAPFYNLLYVRSIAIRVILLSFLFFRSKGHSVIWAATSRSWITNMCWFLVIVSMYCVKGDVAADLEGRKVLQINLNSIIPSALHLCIGLMPTNCLTKTKVIKPSMQVPRANYNINGWII